MTSLTELETLLDKVLGPKLANLWNHDLPVLDRVECKLGMVLDRHHPEKVEAFHEMIGTTKSPLIKEKNIEVFVKGMMSALLADAAKGAATSSSTSATKRGADDSKENVPSSKRAKSSSSGKAKGGGAAKDKAATASAAPDGAKSDTSPTNDSEKKKDETDKAQVIETYDSAMAGSDGKLRGQLHLVERCPALVYRSWKDADHDVYLFGMPQLAAAKRKLAPGGFVAFFPGFGLYKDYTERGFKSIAMGGDTRTCDRPFEEVFAFLTKGTAMRGTKGEVQRRKAYVAAAHFFQEHVYKMPKTEGDPFPALLRKVPSKSGKKKGSTGPKPKKRARGPRYPIPTVPAVQDYIAPDLNGGAPSLAAGGELSQTQEGLAEEATMPEEPMPNPNDHSIRGLFASLRWRMGRFEDVSGGDPFIWSIKSSQSNIDNLCDRLFSDAGDPEADDWKRMIGSGFDKAKKKLEEKLRLIPDPARPAYVHGKALMDIYGDLKEAINKFEEGDEDQAEGWDGSLDDSMMEEDVADLPITADAAAPIALAPAAVAAAKAPTPTPPTAAAVAASPVADNASADAISAIKDDNEPQVEEDDTPALTLDDPPENDDEQVPQAASTPSLPDSVEQDGDDADMELQEEGEVGGGGGEEEKLGKVEEAGPDKVMEEAQE